MSTPLRTVPHHTIPSDHRQRASRAIVREEQRPRNQTEGRLSMLRSPVVLLGIATFACGGDDSGAPSGPGGPVPSVSQVEGTYRLVAISNQPLPYPNAISTGSIGRITGGSLSLVATATDGGDATLLLNEDLRDPDTGACCTGSTVETLPLGWSLSSSGGLTLEGAQPVRATHDGIPVQTITVNVQSLDNTKPPGLFRFQR